MTVRIPSSSLNDLRLHFVSLLPTPKWRSRRRRQVHGRCFAVRKPQEFVDKILSTYFGQSKIASFQRQLSMYGFLRLTQGPDRGCYYHELFLKHKLYLSQEIKRTGVNGNVVKRRVDPKTEPDFYSMPFVEPDPELPDYLQRNEHNNAEGHSNIARK